MLSDFKAKWKIFSYFVDFSQYLNFTTPAQRVTLQVRTSSAGFHAGIAMQSFLVTENLVKQLYCSLIKAGCTWLDWPVHKLQVCILVLIEFAPPEWQNIFQNKCQNNFHICKWISFAISTFVIVEETPS